jgi:LAO/AO transport system kinase
VLLVPEAGDAIQAMKAGLMEIADIFVINKADRDGAERMLTELRLLMHVHPRCDWWEVPVLATQAHKDVGIPELYAAIATHRRTLEDTGQLTVRRRARRHKELLTLLQHRLLQDLLAQLAQQDTLQELVEQVAEATLDPYTAAQRILAAQRGNVDGTH